MANPYSILHNYDNVPLFTHDFESLGNLLQAKQGALNANRQKLQLAADQLGALDIYKDVDKTYAEERLQAVVNNVNKYAGMDLSDQGLATSLTENLNQVMDDNVKNAVYSTKLFKKEQEDWAKAKEKGDGKYWEGNHAYAMQFSKDWRESQKVGDVYKGGGGFIEFVDVNAILNKALPDIAKLHNWEVQKLENGNTIFRTVGTYKSIPKDKVDAAIEAYLGPKERKQLGINAWSKYDAIPDEALKETYDRNIDNKIADREKSIEYYEAIRDKSKDEDYKKQVQSYIDAEKAQVGNLKSSYFDNVGKQGAYTSMYYEEFKTPLLQAYSRDPELIKTEVYDLDDKTFNANMKMQEANLNERKFEFDKDKFALDLRYKYDALSAKGAGTAKKQLNPKTGQYEEVPTLGPAQALGEEDGYKERAEDDLQFIANQEKEGLDAMKAILKANGLPESYVNSPSFIAKITSGEDVITVNKLDGKGTVKINLTDVNVGKAVQKFENFVLNDSPMRKKANENIDKMTSTIIDQLTTSIKNKSTDWDPTKALINPIYKLVEDPKNKGKYITQKIDKSKAPNYYAGLLWKKAQGQKMSEVEELNLTAYTKQQLSQDGSLTEGQQRLIKSNMEKTVLRNVNGVGKQQIAMVEKRTAGNAATGQIVSAVSPMSPILGTVVKTAGNVLSMAGIDVELPKWADPSDRDLSNLSYGDLEWGSSFSGKNPGGVNETMKKYMSAITMDVHHGVVAARMNPTQSTININPDETPGTHAKLVSYLSLPASFKKEAMFLKGVSENGKIVGYDVMYKKENTTKEGGVSTTEIQTISTGSRISVADAKNVLGLKLDVGSGKSMYNALEGENAAKINLGFGVVDYTNLARVQRLRNNWGGSLPLENTKVILDYAAKKGATQEVKEILNAAQNGKVKYQMVAGNTGTYLIEASINGKTLGVSDTGISEMDEETAHSRVKLLSEGHAQSALINILNTQIIPQIETKNSLK